MSVAKVTEVIASSKISFEDAIEQGVAKVSKTVRGICSAWVKEQSVEVKDGKVTAYRVNLKITFVVDE